MTSTAWSSMALLIVLSPGTSRMRKEVPPWISRPSAIFFCGGQIVTTLNTTSNAVSVNASSRFRRPWSVAKYQPKRTSTTSPMKNVSAGVISLSFRAESRNLLLFHCSRFFQHRGDGRFFHLDLHIVGNFNDYRGLLHVGNETVNAGVGHYAVAGL